MSRAKRVFIIGDFRDESAQSFTTSECRRWSKGLVRLGHDVQRFSYRNILLQLSPIGNKSLARWLIKKRVDKILVDQVRSYHPDLVLVFTLKNLDAETVAGIRAAAGSAVFVGRDIDPYPEDEPRRIAIAEKMDIMTATSAGRFLATYKQAGVARCAFLPDVCDPDIQYAYEVEDKWKTDIVFMGKAKHTRCHTDRARYNLVAKLAKMPNAKLYGCFGRPKVKGLDCFYAISGAAITLSINTVNDVRLYHSDRLVNSLACGAFVLAKRVPDSDLLFEDKVHLRYFDSVEEFFDLARWYLEHDEEREKIARAGMERAHKEFNCQKMAGYLMDLIEKGQCEAPWGVILR